MGFVTVVLTFLFFLNSAPSYSDTRSVKGTRLPNRPAQQQAAESRVTERPAKTNIPLKQMPDNNYCDPDHPSSSLILVDDLSPDISGASLRAEVQFKNFSDLMGNKSQTIRMSSFLSKATEAQREKLQLLKQSSEASAREVADLIKPFRDQMKVRGGSFENRLEVIPDELRSRVLELYKSALQARDERADLLKQLGFTKEVVLAKLREARSALGQEDPTLFLIGHGSPRCPNATWCTGSAELAINERELVENVRPRGMFLESCYSGLMAQSEVLRTNSNQDQPIFLYSSALSSQAALALPGSSIAGLLSHALERTASAASSPQICAFDLDGDGKVSEREFASVLLTSFYKNETDAQITGPRGKQSTTMPTPNLPQLPVSTVTDRCLFKIPALVRQSCQQRNSSRSSISATAPIEVNQCRDLASRTEKIATSLRDLRKDDRLNFLYPEGGVTLFSQGDRGQYAATKAEATMFLHDWQKSLSSERARCEEMFGAGHAELCGNIQSSFNGLASAFQDLERIVLELRSSK